jgi:hypothetical protein
MSLRDRLAAAQRRTDTHRLRVEDDAAARAELAAASAADDEDRVAAAQAALDACYETLHLAAMPPADWDALIDAHPAKDGKGWCELVTFLPAALVECVQGEDVTESDWAEWITKGAMSPGEVMALFDAVVILHGRTPDPELGKGSTPTRS